MFNDPEYEFQAQYEIDVGLPYQEVFEFIELEEVDHESDNDSDESSDFILLE